MSDEQFLTSPFLTRFHLFSHKLKFFFEGAPLGPPGPGALAPATSPSPLSVGLSVLFSLLCESVKFVVRKKIVSQQCWLICRCTVSLQSSQSASFCLLLTLCIVAKWQKRTIISMVDSTKVLCPLFDEIEILIPSDNPSIFPSLDKMWNFKSLQKQRKMTFMSSSLNLSGCAKALCPFHSCAKVLSQAVDLLPRPRLLLYDI